MKSLPWYTSCLFFMLLNDNIEGVENPDRICLLTLPAVKYFK